MPKVFVLDGGFSSQMSCHIGKNFDRDPLWCVRFLQTHPDEVVNTHLDFLRAGADIIMTNTYQAWVEGFIKHLKTTADEGYALIGKAVELAKRARNLYLAERQDNSPERKPLIAGSVGPYGAHLHNASEYDGSYADSTSEETMKEWHKPRIEALIAAGVDLLAFETIPCGKEAMMLVELLKDYPTIKAWLSFSCKDSKSLANGENFQTVAKKCWDSNPSQLLAIGANCCSPLIIADLFKGLNNDRKDTIPFVVYPNSGENFDPQLGWIDRDNRETLASFVQEWLDLGVRYIGGCCRTYATDISQICAQVQTWCDKNEFTELNSGLKPGTVN